MPFFQDDELPLLGLSDLVQSDLLNTIESPREAAFQASAKADRSIIDSVAGASFVAIDNEGLNSSDDDEDIGGVEPKMPVSAVKKRGRPSLSRSETPAKPAVTKTPRSTKTAPTPKSTGRKRKAPEPEPEPEEAEEAEEGSEETSEPAKKRGRLAARAAATATSARLAAKAASKPTRGRPKGPANKTEEKAAKPAKGKGGRPKKQSTNGDSTSAEEYEVEEIIDSAIDQVSKEHMYFVKWKGYPASANTWEPKANLAHATELVKAFDAKKKAAAAEKKAEDKAAAAAAKEKKEPKEKKQPKEKKEKPAKAVGKAKMKKELPKEQPTRASGRTRTTRSG